MLKCNENNGYSSFDILLSISNIGAIFLLVNSQKKYSIHIFYDKSGIMCCWLCFLYKMRLEIHKGSHVCDFLQFFIVLVNLPSSVICLSFLIISLQSSSCSLKKKTY